MTHIQDYINEAVAKRKTGKYGDGAIGVGMKLDDCCSTLNSYGLPILRKYPARTASSMFPLFSTALIQKCWACLWTTT